MSKKDMSMRIEGKRALREAFRVRDQGPLALLGHLSSLKSTWYQSTWCKCGLKRSKIDALRRETELRQGARNWIHNIIEQQGFRDSRSTGNFGNTRT